VAAEAAHQGIRHRPEMMSPGPCVVRILGPFGSLSWTRSLLGTSCPGDPRRFGFLLFVQAREYQKLLRLGFFFVIQANPFIAQAKQR
jgi:hypothetical protein